MNAFNVNEHMQALGLQAKTASALMAKAPAATANTPHSKVLRSYLLPPCTQQRTPLCDARHLNTQ